MKKRNRKTERNEMIWHLRQQGMTYKELAQAFDISITRVVQILEVQNEVSILSQ